MTTIINQVAKLTISFTIKGEYYDFWLHTLCGYLIHACDITQEELSRNDIVTGVYNGGQIYWILLYAYFH